MMTTIFEAIDRADFGLAWQLVQNRAGLEDVDEESGLTPLALAAETGMTEVVRTLLEAGVPPDHGGALTPLEAAVLEGDPEIVKLLIDAGANVNRKSGDGYSPLMSAAMAGDGDLAQMLLEAGAKVRAKNEDGDTAIEIAFLHGFDDLGRDLRAFSRKRFEADQEAEEMRKAQAEEEMLERRRQERRQRVEQGRIARPALGSEALASTVTAFAESGSSANPEPRDEVVEDLPISSTGVAPAEAPAEAPAVPTTDRPQPVKWTWSTETQTKKKSTGAPTVGALEVGAPSTAGEALAAFDALFGNLDQTNETVDPASVWGVARYRAYLAVGQEEAALEMVTEGDISPQDRDRGETPLMIAATHGSLEVVNALLAAGAQVDERGEGAAGETALIKAVRHPSAGRENVIRRLVEAGANLEARIGDNSMTPLMFAANADVYEPDPFASVFGGTVRILVDLGARLEATDRRGATAWRMVKRNALGAPTSSPFRRRLYQMQKLLEMVGAAPVSTGV